MEEVGLGWLVPSVFLQRECMHMLAYNMVSYSFQPLSHLFPTPSFSQSLYFLIIFDVYRNAWFYIFTDVR